MRGTARVRAARLWVVGLSAAYGAVAAALVLTLPTRDVKWAMTGLVTLALVAYLPLSRLINMRPVVITVERGLLRLGRFGTARLDRPVARGAWYDRLSGVGLGTYLLVPTDRGRVVRVGGRGLPTPTDLCTAKATRTVDVSLTAAELSQLMVALARVEVDPASPGPVRVALFGRINSGRSGCLRLGLPILVLYSVGLTMGGTMFLLDRWLGPGSNTGVIVGSGCAVLLVSLVATIWITQRRRPAPALTLELHEGRCTVRDRGGRSVAAGRPTWRKLRYQYRDLSGNMRDCPVLELVVASHKPLTLGLLAPEYAWRAKVPETPMPRYLVGSPDWPSLVAALDHIGADRSS